MKIRKATFHDAPFLKLLLGDRQVTASVSELITRMSTGFGDEDHFIFVYEDREEVIGLRPCIICHGYQAMVICW